MKNPDHSKAILDAAREALPEDLVLLVDLMPILGLTNLYNANKLARKGALPIRFFQLRDSTRAPWVARRDDMERYVKKKAR